MRIFVVKLRLHDHFPDSKHLRGFVGHEIFGIFRDSESLGLHPQLYMLATALPPPVANTSGENF